MPKGTKFSVCIANPPYDNGLHEQFLLKFIDIANNIVTIQPISWLLGQHQKKKLTNIIDVYGGIIKTYNGNNAFDAMFGSNIAIIHIDKMKDNKIIFNDKKYDKCLNISSVSNDEYLVEFLNKISNITEYTLHDKLKTTPDNPIYSLQKTKEYHPDPNWWTFQIPAVRGHISNNDTGKSDDFYTLLSKNDSFTKTKILQVKNWPKTNKNFKWNDNVLDLIYVVFNTKQELYNFINNLKTDFERTCLYIKKVNQAIFSGALKLIPWFDFSDPHFSKSPREIDDWLFKKYNISDEIRKHIEGILPDYYNIRK